MSGTRYASDIAYAESIKALSPQQHEAGWTDERVETLKKMWAEGSSATEIAEFLGGGVTRNAVISKVHRLKLDSRANTVRPKVPGRSRNFGQPKAAAIRHRVAVADNIEVDVTVVVGPAWEPIVGVSPIPLLELTQSTCHWPIGDRPTLFCGQHVGSGRYCEEHQRRAYKL